MSTDCLTEGSRSPKLPRFVDDGKRKSRASSAARQSAKGISFMPKDKEQNFDEGKRVFVDAAAMKEKVRQNLTKRKHTVSDYYKTKGLAQKIARSFLFEHITLGVIAFNAIWIAVDTDYNGAEMLLDAHPIFQIAENLFCAFFSFEWMVRYLSFKRKRDGMKDPWFVFDSMLVFTMVLETWALNAYALLTSGGGGQSMGNASILRIARLLRLSRMARMARLLRAMPELMVLIKGMMAATRSVFFTLCLLLLILYVFAIAFKQLCADTEVGNKYFADVAQSMYTLLVHGALLDDVGNFSGILGEQSFAIAAIFFLFSLLAALTVMNMLIGVLCEVVSAVAATEKEEMLVTYVNGKLRQVVDLLDANGDNQISKKEFVEILENIDAARALQEVGVDVVGLIDFAEFIFLDENVEDGEQSEKVLAFSEFMEVVLQLRGSNNATVKDVVDLRKFIRRALIQTNMQLAGVQKALRSSTVDAKNSLAKSASLLRDEERLSQVEKASESLQSAAHQKNDRLAQDYDLKTISTLGNGKIPSNGDKLYSDMEFDDFSIHMGTPQRYFGGVEDLGCPIPPKETPAPNLLHHRAQENERLLWGDRDRGSSLFDVGIAHESHGSGLRRRLVKGKQDDFYREFGDLCQWSDIAQPPQIEVEALRSQITRLGKVFCLGLSEFNKIRESLDDDAYRSSDL